MLEEINNPGNQYRIDIRDAISGEFHNEQRLEDNIDDEFPNEDDECVPKVGLKFEKEEEVFTFYKKYAYQTGFPVRRRNSKKGDDGVVRYVTLSCSREGRRTYRTTNSVKPKPTMQTDCRARVTASVDLKGIWRINTVCLEHNHPLSPTKSRFYRCNRELTANVKRKLEVNDLAGIPLHKSYNSAVVEAGGYENITCSEKDCRNYVEKVRRLRLGEGDAAAIQGYFSKMQAQCPGFYFSMDLDNDGRLRNVSWADYRSREAYKEFGDVVTFDTTYLTNKYDMPFAPFVGVNHHGQSILLGCGLVSNEDTDSFVWLFTTWLECMHGKSPHGIITDQDRAMQNAVRIVFPNTKHRWCLWHIMKKLPEKFGYHVNKGSIFSMIHALVYDSQSTEEFEYGWGSMLDRHELNNNDWLSSLYDHRAYWVPCFFKTTFWAGMSTTQRSESINAFFDGYVHSKTTLKQFVEQYERALRSKVEKELQADFGSYSQMVPCATKYEFERQFQAVYTISKFKEFQNELTGKVYCDLLSSREVPFGSIYEVREDVIINGRVIKKIFVVSFKRENCIISCSCHLFEFRGILCRHAIVILIRNDITSLPNMYILRRWRRDVRRAHTRVAVNYDGLVATPMQQRYDEMCQAFASVADLASENEARTRTIMEWIKVTGTELNISKLSSGGECRPSYKTTCGSILDPKYTKRKGAPRKLRKKSPLELMSKSKIASKVDKGKRPGPSHMQERENFMLTTQESEYSRPAPFSYSQLLLSGEIQALAQPQQHMPTFDQFSSSTFVPPSSENGVFDPKEGGSMSYSNLTSQQVDNTAFQGV